MRNLKYKSNLTTKEVEELHKSEVERLGKIIETLTEEERTMILRGQRPLRIEYNDFCILRKSYRDQVKKYLKHR